MYGEKTIWLLQAIPAYSQHYIIEHFSNENGLPVQSIKGMALDKNSGFLWVGTQAGLVRFDGRHFKGLQFIERFSYFFADRFYQEEQGGCYLL